MEAFQTLGPNERPSRLNCQAEFVATFLYWGQICAAFTSYGAEAAAALLRTGI